MNIVDEKNIVFLFQATCTPRNPKKSRLIVGSMNMGYDISDTLIIIIIIYLDDIVIIVEL